jgi:peptidoglycan hydrolase-like protein with peptidoglycan-binding domain
MADVSVDGKPAVKVGLHSTGPAYRKMVWSTGTLPSGKHTVNITWDEGNAAGTFISVDAFNILGTVPWPKSLTRDQVKWMEQRLSDLSYRPGTIDGIVDKKTTGAVIAFQKWEGMTRNGTISVDVLTRLQTATRPKASRVLDTNPSLEVIKGKQVMLFCKDGEVVWTLHVCTGSASVGIITPSATFHITRKTRELSPLYLPMYLRNTKLAIHGYPSVPVYPASHGCVRTQFWDEDVIYPLIAVGTAVYIHD